MMCRSLHDGKRSLFVFVAASMIVAPAMAETSTLRVSQETAPGLGNFDENIVGFITTFDRSEETAVEIYNYQNNTYNGSSPLPENNGNAIFFVAETIEGPVLFVVHKIADGTKAGMVLEEPRGLSLDMLLVKDDDLGDFYEEDGANKLGTEQSWGGSDPGDGFALALDLDGLALTISLTAFVGPNAWRAISSNLENFDLSPQVGWRVLLEDFSLADTVVEIAEAQKKAGEDLIEALKGIGTPDNEIQKFAKQNDDRQKILQKRETSVKQYAEMVVTKYATDKEEADAAIKRAQFVEKNVFGPERIRNEQKQVKDLQKIGALDDLEVQKSVLATRKAGIGLVKQDTMILEGEIGKAKSLAEKAKVGAKPVDVGKLEDGIAELESIKAAVEVDKQAIETKVNALAGTVEGGTKVDPKDIEELTDMKQVVNAKTRDGAKSVRKTTLVAERNL